jgi:hypothetical protein
MLYLASFYKVILKNPVKGLFFFIFSGLFIWTSAHFSHWESSISKYTRGKGQGSYFHVLFSGKENLAWIQRKIKGLPGVNQVQVLKKNVIQDQVKDILKDIGPGQMKNILKLDFMGMKVGFKDKLNKRSQTLIRDYLYRLVGKDKVTMGPVKTPGLLAQGQSVLNKLKNVGIWSILSLLLFLWGANFFLLFPEVRKESYLIETFQRKKYVAAKTLLCGLSSILVFWFLTTFLLKVPQMTSILAIFIFVILFSGLGARKWSWDV